MIESQAGNSLAGMLAPRELEWHAKRFLRKALTTDIRRLLEQVGQGCKTIVD